MEEGEEERATTVPNREGKVKSQWTVATVHEEAPRPTRLFEKYKRTRRRLPDMLERDHMSTKHHV